MKDEIPSHIKERAAAKASYIKQLLRFLGLLALLMVINLLTSPGYLWFLWVALFGGIGFVVQGVKVFGNLSTFEQNLQKHFEKREMEKEGKE